MVTSHASSQPMLITAIVYNGDVEDLVRNRIKDIANLSGELIKTNNYFLKYEI